MTIPLGSRYDGVPASSRAVAYSINPARFRQPGFDCALLLTPNPSGPGAKQRALNISVSD